MTATANRQLIEELAAWPVEGGPKLAEMLTILSLRLYAPERSWTIELLTADEQAGAAQVRLSTSLAGSGDAYENVYVYFFRFADGKIAEVWEHLDTAYAFALFDRALGKQ